MLLTAQIKTGEPAWEKLYCIAKNIGDVEKVSLSLSRADIWPPGMLTDAADNGGNKRCLDGWYTLSPELSAGEEGFGDSISDCCEKRRAPPVWQGFICNAGVQYICLRAKCIMNAHKSICAHKDT